MDFLTVPTLTFNVLYCFFIISHDRRRILHCKVTRHPTSVWIAQQLRETFPYDAVPKFLLLHHDAKYGFEVPSVIRSMNIAPVGPPFPMGCEPGGTNHRPDLFAEQLGDGSDDSAYHSPPDPIAVETQLPGLDGMYELKAKIERDVIQGLRYPEEVRRCGLLLANDTLLHGTTGCGKTCIAPKIARATPSTSLNRTRKRPGMRSSVLFVDELDTLGFKRSLH